MLRRESEEVEITWHETTPVSIASPRVILEVTEAEQAVKGNSATNIKKDAVRDRLVRVPLHVHAGDKVKVNTDTGVLQGALPRSGPLGPAPQRQTRGEPPRSRAVKAARSLKSPSVGGLGALGARSQVVVPEDGPADFPLLTSSTNGVVASKSTTSCADSVPVPEVELHDGRGVERTVALLGHGHEFGRVTPSGALAALGGR